MPLFSLPLIEVKVDVAAETVPEPSAIPAGNPIEPTAWKTVPTGSEIL